MKRVLILLTFFVNASVLADKVVFEDCGSEYDLWAVDIDGCGRKVPCHLSIGEPTNVTIYYIAGFKSDSLSESVTVTLNGVQKNTEVSPRACEATYCPVKINANTNYSTKLLLPNGLALNTRGILNWEIRNENSVKVICFGVTIHTLPSFGNYNFEKLKEIANGIR